MSNFSHAAQLQFFPLGLIEHTIADGQVFIGDAVGLKEDSLGPRLPYTPGDDVFERQDKRSSLERRLF